MYVYMDTQICMLIANTDEHVYVNSWATECQHLIFYFQHIHFNLMMRMHFKWKGEQKKDSKLQKINVFIY